MSTYKIVRYYFKGENEVIRRGLNLEEAQEHCSDPETSSKTCEKEKNVKRTALFGPWFDGYVKEV